MPGSASTRQVLLTLRVPCARSVDLVFGYAKEPKYNPGYTLRIPAGEKVTAPGAGTVLVTGNVPIFYSYSNSALAGILASEVVIDHGENIRTVVHGLTALKVGTNQVITRGQELGDPLCDQVFFGILQDGKPVNPAIVSEHFVIQDGGKVIGQGGKLKFGPDFFARDLSGGIVQAFVGGIRYFANALGLDKVLFNIDFNGNSTKTGLAATGYASSDYWNVYTPLAFASTPVFGCNAYGLTFSAPVVEFLRNYLGETTPIRLVRVAPLTADAGTTASFDTMLGTWIGGYSGPTPILNQFEVHGLPAGDYSIYCYANSGSLPDTSVFWAYVNDGAGQQATNTPTADAAFVEGRNYVKFALTLPSNSTVLLKCYGYWSGLQIIRV